MISAAMKALLAIWLTLSCLLPAAGLDFPETLKEIHAPADAKTVSANFIFTNRSDKAVTVREYKSTCSCMAVKIKDGKLRYAPGESGLIRADFDMGNFSGEVDKVVALWLDEDRADKPSLTLTVRVHIPVLVAMEPKTVKWDLDGDISPQTIRIEMKHTRPIRIKTVTSSSETFQHELKTIEEGKTYELEITPKTVKSPGLAILRIETDSELEKQKIQQVFAVIRKPTPAEAAGKP
jgi:hypothetical protein